MTRYAPIQENFFRLSKNLAVGLVLLFLSMNLFSQQVLYRVIPGSEMNQDVRSLFSTGLFPVGIHAEIDSQGEWLMHLVFTRDLPFRPENWLVKGYSSTETLVEGLDEEYGKGWRAFDIAFTPGGYIVLFLLVPSMTAEWDVRVVENNWGAFQESVSSRGNAGFYLYGGTWDQADQMLILYQQTNDSAYERWGIFGADDTKPDTIQAELEARFAEGWIPWGFFIRGAQPVIMFRR
jgi:hypothetical protein